MRRDKSDVDWEKKQVRVFGRKTKTYRTIPVKDAFLVRLREMRAISLSQVRLGLQSRYNFSKLICSRNIHLAYCNGIDTDLANVRAIPKVNVQAIQTILKNAIPLFRCPWPSVPVHA